MILIKELRTDNLGAADSLPAGHTSAGVEDHSCRDYAAGSPIDLDLGKPFMGRDRVM